MASQQPYECFNIHGNGHFYSADTLFDQGIWIGHLSETSQGARYRNLPSFRELEDNYENIRLPHPDPLDSSPSSDREAVCRGCFSDKSSVLQLRDIKFGLDSKLIIMPLDGDLFCIMMPQPLDRSIKALETFRPYEHQIQRNNDRPFFNNYMLVAVRHRVNNYGLLHTVRSVLEPTELSKHKQRPSYPGLDDQTNTKLPAKTSSTSIGHAKIKMHKRKLSVGSSAISSGRAKLHHSVAHRDPRSSARVTQLSDDGIDEDEMAAPLSVPNARSLSSRTNVEKKIPEPRNDIAEQPPLTTFAHHLKKTTNRQFTDHQACCTHFVWKIDFENMEHEVRRTLSTIDTFQELLGSFREEAEVVPSASRHMRASIWSARYKLADGSGNACFIRTSSPYSELSFDWLLRSLIEKEAWKKDPHVIVDIELKAVLQVSGN